MQASLHAYLREKFLHHFRWRDIYHFHRPPVYQHFQCDQRKSRDLLRV